MRALLVVAAILIAGHASAHGWYTGLKNENGYSCCGDNDCGPLAEGDVEEVAGGYFVKSRSLFVPFSRTKPSVDRHYHICIVPSSVAVDNAPRCFFAPQPGS